MKTHLFELAVRSAMGASRVRLLWATLSETLWLAVPGAAIGRALRSMPRSPDKRFYLKPSLWAEYPDLGRWVRRRNINLALDAYAGFGRLSVPGGFAEQYGGSRTSTDLTTYNEGGADAKYHR